MRDRIERVRRVAGGRPSAPAGRLRRVSRREREARRERQLRLGIGLAGGIAALILIVASVNDYWIKPRSVLASVDGTEIRRRDYWKVRSINLIEQAAQYQQVAGFVQGEQQTQYLQLAAQAREQLQTVWGGTDVDSETLQQMVDDQVYLKNLDDFEIEVTDADVDDFVNGRFGAPNAVDSTPSPTPTLIPARAAWATGTAEANASATAAALAAATAAALAAAPVPTSGALPLSPGASAIATVAAPAVGSLPVPPGITATVEPTAVPTVPSTSATSVATFSPSTPASTPAGGTPVPSPTPAGTPGPVDARATAAANFDDFEETALETAHMSTADYEHWVVRPTVARQKATAAIEAQVGQSAEQVRAAHILVATQDLARDIHTRVTTGGQDFAEVAGAESTDEATGANGGDLGWFTRAEVVDPFAEAAFALPPGQTSEPFQTEFGWHIVRVFEHEADRAMTDEQITKVKDDRVQDWLRDQRAEMDIDADIDPTPTPFSQPFAPPAAAPPPPTPTPVVKAVPLPVPSPAGPVATPAP